MNISKARGSICLSLIALSACAANTGAEDDAQTGSAPLTAETVNTASVVGQPTRWPVVLCTVPAITEYAMPSGSGTPEDIVTGPDGNLWFTDSGTSKIGQFSPSTSTFAEFALTANSGPAGITAGPDGNLWFAEMQRSQIGQMSTSGALLNEFANPSNWASGHDQPYYITSGPNGDLWFSGYAIGQISTSGVITPVSTPNSLVGSLGIANGPDGNVWFVQESGGIVTSTGVVVRTTPAGSMTPISLPPSTPNANSMPWGITAGPDGNMWVVGNNIWQVSTSGKVLNTYALSGLPSYDFHPSGITTGSDGNLWFTEFATNQIGRITTSGAITQWTVGGSSGVAGPTSITAGPDGALWFTEYMGHKIGRITPSVCHVEYL